MLETQIDKGIFKIKEIWFADKPFDVKDCDAVIFRACKDKAKVDGFECSEFKTLVIDLTQDLDIIFKNFEKKSCQYQVKRALRDNVQSQLDSDYCGFYSLNESFRELKNLDGLTDVEYLKKYGTLFTAKIDNQLVSGQIYLEDESNIRWLLGASKRLESNNVLIGCASRLLIWQAIQYAKNKGIKEFDFGGYHMGNIPELKAINFFKESFGGKLVTHYIYEKDYSVKYKLAKTLKQMVSG